MTVVIQENGLFKKKDLAKRFRNKLYYYFCFYFIFSSRVIQERGLFKKKNDLKQHVSEISCIFHLFLFTIGFFTHVFYKSRTKNNVMGTSIQLTGIMTDCV